MISARATALRPGFQLGDYPERASDAGGMVERVTAALGQRLRSGLRMQQRGLKKFVARVVAVGEPFAALDEREFRRRIELVRHRLHRDGLTEHHLVEAFAVVREAGARSLGMRHYEVQLMAGRVLLDGRLAEMETGEGKTLMATLPAAVAALAGIPVHVITVNDYLVARDAAKMTPLYNFLGLTVGVIQPELQEADRRAAYAADVTYCTNSQLVFDYLRDRLSLKNAAGNVSLRAEQLYSERSRLDSVMLRGLCYCIVDEADSVLIDEAATPLILSQGGRLSEQDEQLYRQAVQLAQQLQDGEHYTLNERNREVQLTDAGITEAMSAAAELGGQWRMRTRTEELLGRALTACHLYRRDRDYLVRDGQVMIIDDFTGRVMSERKWEQGLHQMIEVKEDCDISPPNEVLARLSYQKFFRRYLLLSGMTGTARETAPEMNAVYGLEVVKIPTRCGSQLEQLPDCVCANQDAKWRTVVEAVSAIHAQARPVLVGTRSVADSEILSERLTAAGLAHQVLNARQDADEAELVAQAGQAGAITIATNMAGRGTDIPLGDGVDERGGLHVIATERNTARRIDRQLFGRAGRQGAPGSYQGIHALDDRLVGEFLPKIYRALAASYARSPDRVPDWAGRLIMSSAQRRAERLAQLQRRALERMDEYLGKMLAFTGKSE